MKNLDIFLDSMKNRFPYDLTFEDCLSKAAELYGQKQCHEALLLLTFAYHTFPDKKEKVIDKIAFLFSLNQIALHKCFKLGISNLAMSFWFSTSEKPWGVVFREALVGCVKFPLSQNSRTILFSATRMLPEKLLPYEMSKLTLLQEMEEYANTFSNPDMIAFYVKIVKSAPKKGENTPHIKAFTSLVIREIVRTNKSIALSLFAEALYLGDRVFMENVAYGIHISGLSVEKEYYAFLADPEWHFCSTQEMKKLYEQICIQQESGIRDTVLSDQLEKASLTLLVALVLYAQEQKNIPVTSLILFSLFKKHDFPKLFERLEELAGGHCFSPQIKEIQSTSTRVSYVYRKMTRVQKIGQETELLLASDLGTLKDMYVIQPFDLITVRALIRYEIYVPQESKKIKEMYTYSIKNISSCFVLTNLLVFASRMKNQTAIQCLLERLYVCYCGQAILDAAEKIATGPRDTATLSIASQIVYFYEQMFPVEEHLKDRVKSIKNSCVQSGLSSKASILLPFSYEVLLTDEPEFLLLYRNKKYTKVLSLLQTKTDVSVPMLEIGLYAAMTINAHQSVVALYEQLKMKDRSKAMLYTTQVQKSFMFVYADERETKSPHGLVRTGMWGDIVAFSTPIDSTAAKVLSRDEVFHSE